MNLFLDTNILLSFYHLTDEDLEELRKLVALMDQGKIVLFFPTQVQDEFSRNRESTIADGLKRFKEQRLPNQYPAICKHYEQYDRLRNLVREYDKVKNDLLVGVMSDIRDRELSADEVIDDLVACAQRVEIDESITSAAQTRRDVGNPPGKRGSLGDALNWEALLEAVPDGEDLYFISDDADYSSVFDKDTFNSFLSDEWRLAKQAKIIFYRRLSSFFKAQYPAITLSIQVEKETLIRDLASSPSFADTHNLIRKLNDFSEFTRVEINSLVNVALSNPQVRWIMGDSDVQAFFSTLIEDRESSINEQALAELKTLLNEEED